MTNSPQKLKLEKINGTLIILFYVSPSSPQLQRICFFVKNIKDAIHKQLIGGNTPILALKRMLEYFLEIPPLKEILELKN